jgi:ParB-like chromosome segregation protein Spo0J
MTSEIPFHPLADIFPLLDPKEQMSLSDDIKAHGLHEPIVMHEGKILDGRNRYQACLMAGVDPTQKEFDGPDPLAFVISANLHRRHLTDEQRALVADKIATMKQGARTDLSPIGEMSQAKAADAMKVAKRMIERVRKVRKDGAPELVAALEQGRVTPSAAAAVASLPIEEQKEIVAKGAPAVAAAAKTVTGRLTPNEKRWIKERTEYYQAKAAKAMLAEVHLGERAIRTRSACGIVYGDNSEAWLAAHPGSTMKDFERELSPRTPAQAEADPVPAHDLKTPPSVAVLPARKPSREPAEGSALAEAIAAHKATIGEADDGRWSEALCDVACVEVTNDRDFLAQLAYLAEDREGDWDDLIARAARAYLLDAAEGDADGAP